MKNQRIRELLDKKFSELTDADKSEIDEDRRLFSLAVSELCREWGWQYAAVLNQSPHSISAGLQIIPLTEPTAPEAEA